MKANSWRKFGLVESPFNTWTEAPAWLALKEIRPVPLNVNAGVNKRYTESSPAINPLKGYEDSSPS